MIENLTDLEIAQELWKILDDIDTLSDIYKPNENNPNSMLAFYNTTMKYVAKRFEYLNSNGYSVFQKVDNTISHFDSKEYKAEKLKSYEQDIQITYNTEETIK